MPNFKVAYENKLKAVLEYLDGNTTQMDKTAVEEYIYYYNNNRYQEKLGCLSPMEYHNLMAA